MDSKDKDYMVRTMAGQEQIRAFAITSRNLVEYAKNIHHLSHLASAALGRLMSAGLMMGDMLKSDSDLLTIQMMGDGPLKHLLVTADDKGRVKGYVSNPGAELPLREDGHLDIGRGIGKGNLTVIRDFHMKDPYSSTINLHSGEIADDLTYYFAQSEQTPSSVGLGVLVNPDSTIACAGGFIIQLMPFTKEETINHLQENLSHFTSVTDVLSQGKSPEDMLRILLDGFDIQFTDHKECMFYCGCEERKEQILMSVGRQAIQEMIKEGKDVETSCAFCEKKYKFNVEQLQSMLEEMDSSSK
jgi:molecular chaperone Hsp33